jgi:hypothetical protein
MLATPAIDVWVATADGGQAHLVPLSLAWVDERAVIALKESSPTARNLLSSRTARLAVGPTRDVVVLDVDLEQSLAIDENPALAESYAAQADWDPRQSTGYVFLVLRPHRVQAWREVNEMTGRTLMRHGTWTERHDHTP